MSSVGKYIDLLVQLLAIPAVSRNEDTRAAFLLKWMTREGFTVKRIHNNLLVTRNTDPARAGIMLNAHMDTVAPAAGWSSDPWLPVRSGGKITGLGSNDDGASLVALVAAFDALAGEGKTDDIVLVLSAEEEVSGVNGLGAVLPELPGLRFAIVGEPTGMQPAVAERGLMVIDAVASGKAGHAARNEGVNAIYRAVDDIAKIRAMKFPDHSEWLDDPSVSVTMINAGTAHNVVPAECTVVIDVRSNDRYSNEKLLEMLGDRCGATLSPRSMRLRSSFLEAVHPVFPLLEQMNFKPYGSPTLSDMALLNIPAIKIGPGESSRSHSADEYVLEDEIGGAIDIYQQLIGNLLKLEL